MNIQNSQRGNVLFIILIAVALLAALSATMMQGGGQQAVSISADKLASEVYTQAQGIRSALIECNLTYNYGYPSATYNGAVGNVECQVDDVPTYTSIFTGSAGSFLQDPPKGFGDWQYYNDGAGGISISLSSTVNLDNARSSALGMAAGRFASSEISLVNTVGAPGSITLYITKP